MICDKALKLRANNLEFNMFIVCLCLCLCVVHFLLNQNHRFIVFREYSRRKCNTVTKVMGLSPVQSQDRHGLCAWLIHFIITFPVCMYAFVACVASVFFGAQILLESRSGGMSVVLQSMMIGLIQGDNFFCIVLHFHPRISSAHSLVFPRLRQCHSNYCA